MGFYADVINLVERAEEQLSIADLNIDDVVASLSSVTSPEIQQAKEVASCPANDVIIRLSALLEHCASIAQKSCSINEHLNDLCREEESVLQIGNKAQSVQSVKIGNVK